MYVFKCFNNNTFHHNPRVGGSSPSSATKNPDLFIDLDVYAGFDWHIPLLWYRDRMESLYQTLCLDPSHGTSLNDLTYIDHPQIGLNGSAIP